MFSSTFRRASARSSLSINPLNLNFIIKSPHRKTPSFLSRYKKPSPLTPYPVCLPQSHLAFNFPHLNAPPHIPSLSNALHRHDLQNPTNARLPDRKPPFPLHPPRCAQEPRCRGSGHAIPSCCVRLCIWLCARLWRYVLSPASWKEERRRRRRRRRRWWCRGSEWPRGSRGRGPRWVGASER